MTRRSLFKLIPFLPLALKAKVVATPKPFTQIGLHSAELLHELRLGVCEYEKAWDKVGLDWRNTLRQKAIEASWIQRNTTDAEWSHWSI